MLRPSHQNPCRTSLPRWCFVLRASPSSRRVGPPRWCPLGGWDGCRVSHPPKHCPSDPRISVPYTGDHRSERSDLPVQPPCPSQDTTSTPQLRNRRDVITVFVLVSNRGPTREVSPRLYRIVKFPGSLVGVRSSTIRFSRGWLCGTVPEGGRVGLRRNWVSYIPDPVTTLHLPTLRLVEVPHLPW